MIANKLRKGDTIGIVSPSHVASIERYNRILYRIESKGFNTRTGENLYKNTFGYLASDFGRSDDFNNMIMLCQKTN